MKKLITLSKTYWSCFIIVVVMMNAQSARAEYVKLTAVDGMLSYGQYEPGGAETYDKLVDANIETKWGGWFNPALSDEDAWPINTTESANHMYIIVKAEKAAVPTFYFLVTSDDTGKNPGRNWASWKIYGGNFATDADAVRNGEGWTLVDDKEDEPLPAANLGVANLEFDYTGGEAFQYYWIELEKTAANAEVYQQMSEWGLGTYGEFENYLKMEETVIYYNFDEANLVAEVTYSPYGDKYKGDIVIPSSVIHNGEIYGVTSIGDRAFDRCYDLTSITIPNSVTKIGEEAFFGCESLTSITIPNSVTSIGGAAFYGCSSLQYNEYSNAYYLGNNENPYLVLIKPKTTDITACVINEGCKFIHSEAFRNCSGLTSITIPGSVTSIGGAAFYGCSSLQYNEYSNAYYLGNNENPYLVLIKPKTTDITTCEINENSKIIYSYAFQNCSSLTSITIPGSVTSIGECAFLSCWGLTSVTIPNSVTKIGEEAFFGCESLTSITIPNSVTSIPGGTFAYCESLTSITIPESVTSIGDYAFRECSGLTSVTIPNSVTNIGKYPFEGCISLSSVTLHCKEVGSWFFGMGSIKKVVLGNEVKIISYLAFALCTGLTSIIIPNSVTEIGEEAFLGCESLTSITIPNSVTSISVEAFANCSSLTSVTIPNSVISIGGGAFFGCSGLTSITIPESVKSIGEKAFGSCSGLTDVYCFADNVPAKNINAFGNTPIASATLHVPAGSIDLYKATSPWSGFGSIVALTTDMADIEINETNFPDANFRSWVNQEFGADGVLSDAEVATATYINVSNRGIQNLKGIECFTELTELDCSYNLLTTLDVTKNTKLNTLDLSYNNLSGDITGICEYMITSGPSSPIISLNISNNKLSGNIGLFANYFTNLKSLNASGNCLEDVYPMISATVTSLDISRQTISRVVPLHLAKLSISDIGTKVPSILLYDHVNQTFTSNINLMCNTADNSWGMMMSYQNGQLVVPYVSEQNTYYGESGDTLNVAVYNNDSTPEGSTFRISLSFDEGDGNFDGQVNVLDLQTDILYIMEKYSTHPYNFTAANLWDDNLINVQDVIRLVELLMNIEQTESASNARRKAQGYETDTEATIYIQDGQLMLNTSEPVAALDILLNNASSINVAGNLERMGMSVVTKKASDGLHIIAYSMSGNCIPSGISTIGIVDPNAASVRSVMISDSEANAISVSIEDMTTGIESAETENTSSQVTYDLQGRRVNKMSNKGIYIKNGHKIAK